MTHAEIKDAVLRILATIAPEVRGQDLAPSVSLREQLDLDSMDALNISKSWIPDFRLNDAIGSSGARRR